MNFKTTGDANLRRAWLVEQLASVSVVVVIMVVVTSPYTLLVEEDPALMQLVFVVIFL